MERIDYENSLCVCGFSYIAPERGRRPKVIKKTVFLGGVFFFRVPPDSCGPRFFGHKPLFRRDGDFVDLFHLLGIGGHPAPTLHDQQNGRG